MNTAETTPSDDDLEDYGRKLARDRRRRLVAAGVGLAAVAGLVVLLVSRISKPAFDRDRVAKIRGAMSQLPPEVRQSFAAAALAELEEGRLPEQMIAALKRTSD